ncbi:MAG: chromosome segregation protein SMC [Rhodobacteraceae bacterium]|nr:chromosome segregation protein SMC [Paracoccaceae bacterium]
MQFTRLRLNGFKSFVDPTDLLIRPGLTGVVGPNGCGKSNLLEALRWVMGENRPTAMRGGGMEDVIFAGSGTRNARHFAEVALQVDNSDRRAPAGFNNDDQIEITRRITREAGSAYRLNGKDVRARDVQMLFADASTGAHSPALVRQGQIAELINARPRARRRILEEAAGIAGLYQRRHEAELKLNGTEANLARVTDVLEQMAAQLAALARQARQAARYRALGAELRQAEGMLLFLRWREADALCADAEASLRAALGTRGRAEAAVTAAATARAGAEDALPPLREEAAVSGAILQRVQVQAESLDEAERRAAETLRAIESRLAQMDADIDRETALNADAGAAIARLEQEAAELDAAQDGHGPALTDAEARAEAAAAELDAQERALSGSTEDAARLAARHQAAMQAVSEAAQRLERLREAAATTARTATEADSALSAAEAAMQDSAARLQSSLAEHAAADAALSEAEAALATLQEAESRSRARRTEAEGVAGTLRAEVQALGRLVERDTDASGTVLNALTVADGYEHALGAALGDDLRAPLAEGDGVRGWHRLPPLDAAPPLPEGAEPLAAHVDGPEHLNRRLSQTGIAGRAEAKALHAALAPGQRLVSVEGDLWRWDGLHLGAADASGAAAMRLQQVNRLRRLRADLASAEDAAAAARAAHAADETALSAQVAQERQLRTARRTAEAQVSAARSALSRAETARDRAQGRRDAARDAQARQTAEAETQADTLAAAETALANEADPAAARAQVEGLRAQVEAARSATLAARAKAADLRREGERHTRRRQEITRELDGWRQRLDSASARMADLEHRREESRGELKAAADLPATLAAQRTELARAIADAQSRQTAAQDALAAAETALATARAAERDAERAAGEARETQARAEARAEAARDARTAAAARIAEERDQSPAALRAALDSGSGCGSGSGSGSGETLPTAEALETEVARLRRARESLGAVNLRAEEDARALQAESDMLTQERADLEAAVAKLRGGIAALNREGRERLLVAFERVNGNFATLFAHLFGGGEARLVLVESDDPLEAGLEIMCQPPGKKLSTLSLLSGGEQTLTALALIFAVFLANPAPICVLDEVDAPLDDSNVARFCDLLDEMTRRTETRFLIITHNAITMARMDRLFGVTMVEQGVSQLVSVDLHDAEALVA